MKSKNAIARYDRTKRQWSISEGDLMGSFDTCILSGCTIEIQKDAKSVEDVIFYGSHFQNPKVFKLTGEIFAIFFNAETKRFEDERGRKFNPKGHYVNCPQNGRIFWASKSIAMQ